MENGIKSKDLIEALEQIRMAFTASRIGLAACTVLWNFKQSDKWGKKFTKVQQDYHQFLLDTYNQLEKEYKRLLKEEEKEEKDEEANALPQNVIEEILNNPYKANGNE